MSIIKTLVVVEIARGTYQAAVVDPCGLEELIWPVIDSPDWDITIVPLGCGAEILSREARKIIADTSRARFRPPKFQEQA